MSKPIVVIGNIEEIIERNKPMKPERRKVSHTVTHYNCSVCNSRLDIPQFTQVNFCHKCGQRIDWGNKDE